MFCTCSIYQCSSNRTKNALTFSGFNTGVTNKTKVGLVSEYVNKYVVTASGYASSFIPDELISIVGVFGTTNSGQITKSGAGFEISFNQPVLSPVTITAIYLNDPSVRTTLVVRYINLGVVTTTPSNFCSYRDGYDIRRSSVAAIQPGCNTNPMPADNVVCGGICPPPTIVGISNNSITTTIFGTALFEVSSNDNVDRYQWYKVRNGATQPFSNGDLTTIAGTTSNLTVSYTRPFDEGKYAVVGQKFCTTITNSDYTFFDLFVNTFIPSGVTPQMPPINTTALGGDFSMVYTNLGFLTPVDSIGDFNVTWAAIEGVDTERGDTYCIIFSLNSDFSKLKEICGLTTTSIALNASQLNAFNLTKRVETEANKQVYYFKVAYVSNGFKSPYSNTGSKAYINSDLNVTSYYTKGNVLRFAIYPNPTSGTFIIESKTSKSYEISDIVGKVISQGTLTENKTEIVENLPTGIYIVSVGNERVKLVVR